MSETTSETTRIDWHSKYTWDEERKEVDLTAPELQNYGLDSIYFDIKDICDLLNAIPPEYQPVREPNEETLKLEARLKSAEEQNLAHQDMRRVLDLRIEEQRGTLRGLQRAHDDWKAEAQRKDDEHSQRLKAQQTQKAAEDSLKAEVEFRNTITTELKNQVRTLTEINEGLRARNEKYTEAVGKFRKDLSDALIQYSLTEHAQGLQERAAKVLEQL